VKTYKPKFYSENIEKLRPECPLTSYILEPTEKHTATVIFFHGLGDTGKGWSEILDDAFRAKLPYVKFLLPNAPNRPVTCNDGHVMPAWFDLDGLNSKFRIYD
jgi:predicted esterase